ncbi:unnamed protein product [Caenorhabditis auriculariae]|uniref:Uncharacterized protein n=1 Tax=Caenorhabditis auriculariae TaxID=2777116 RepID=A0A8S1GX10_9PELO|nr:unnamed protein product [Caenorhabditis auriculariae]
MDEESNLQKSLKEIFKNNDVSSHILKEQARIICSTFLGGVWSKVSAEKISIRAITGGLSNLLYLVELPKASLSVGIEPKSVLLRIHCLESDPVQTFVETMSFSILSERSLGPKLYGFFDGGRIEEFIKSKTLLCDDISKPEYAKLIGIHFSRFHTLEIPISKEPRLIFFMRSFLQSLKKTETGQKPISLILSQVELHTDQYPSQVTLADLEKEIDLLEEFYKKGTWPVVFTHNDLHEGNILQKSEFDIRSDGVYDVQGRKVDEDPLVFVDFEWCCYNYRGFDLAHQVVEYAFDYTNPEPPYYKIYQDRFEWKDVRRTLCSSYINKLYEMSETAMTARLLLSGDKEKDTEALLEEVELFVPASHLLWGIWNMADLHWTLGGAVVLPTSGNRVSTRSTRKKKSSIITPKKLIENLQSKTPSKKLEEGILEIYKDMRKESASFFNYFKPANKDKNAKSNVWLFDSSRVILAEAPDYYHASFVDGYARSSQYILAQAPFNLTTQKDFFRMVFQNKVEVIVILDGSEEIAKLIQPKPEGKFGSFNVKVLDEKSGENLKTSTLAVGNSKVKVYTLKWTSDMDLPGNLLAAHDIFRGDVGWDIGGPMLFVCKDGVTRCGLFTLLDTESQRIKTKQRVRLGDTVRCIRNSRSHAFDVYENFELAINLIIELCKRKKDI